MKIYIFLTNEGYTYQPNSDFSEPDIENLQVIGFAKGEDSKEAFRNLVKENGYLCKTNFDEVFCYQLINDYEKGKTYYHLTDLQ